MAKATDGPREVLEKFDIMATLGVTSGRPPSTRGGIRGSVRFDIDKDTAQQLLAHLGERSFQVKFMDIDLGGGFTVARLAGRPDAASGSSVHVLDLSVPEEATKSLGKLFQRSLIGVRAPLILEAIYLAPRDQVDGQTALDEHLDDDEDEDLLPGQATPSPLRSVPDEPTGCPYPGCTLEADHAGPHVPDDAEGAS